LRHGPTNPGSEGRSFIGGGRARVRAALFMAAMVGTRHNPVLKAFRDKLVALVATARKLLTILNAMVRDRQKWEAKHGAASN
jgi:transposase